MLMRGVEDEALNPKYAHVERERRWLVDIESRPDISALAHILIEDHYISNSRFRLRRMTDSTTHQSVCKLTKKYESADPLARPIVTAYLSDSEYALFESLPAQILIKRRYKIIDGGLNWTLDCFDGDLAGHELLEIEWPDDMGLRKLSPPSWAIREVSNDARFQGGSLVTDGFMEN